MTTVPQKQKKRDLFRDLDIDLAILASSVDELKNLEVVTDRDAALVQNVGMNLTAVLNVYRRVYGLVRTARIDAEASLSRDRVCRDGLAGWPIPSHADVCERISKLGQYVDVEA